VGLSAPAAIRNATQEYRQAEDTFSIWIDECCSVSPELTGNATALLDSFIEFSRLRFTSATKFGRMLSEHGFTKRKSNGKSIWEGLSLQQSDSSDSWTPFPEKSYRESSQNSFPKTASTSTTGTDLPFSSKGAGHSGADKGDEDQAGLLGDNVSIFDSTIIESVKLPDPLAWLEGKVFRSTGEFPGVWPDGGLTPEIIRLTVDNPQLQADLLRSHVPAYSPPAWIVSIRLWQERARHLVEVDGLGLNPANWQSATEFNLLAFAEELHLIDEVAV
jgi:hypothetical protein